MTPLGITKLKLMAEGVFIADDVRRLLEQAGESPAEESPLLLSLADDFFVQTSIRGVGTTLPHLKLGSKGMILTTEEGEISIIPLPSSKFLKQQKEKRTPVSSNIELDGYCLNLFMRILANKNHLNMEETEVLGILRALFAEGMADLIQLNMDFCPDADRGLQYLEPIIKSIKRNFRTFVSLRGFPPEDFRVIDKMYASGVDVLVLPLEGFSSATDPEEFLPTEHSHKALEYAAGVFPQGSVATELILHPESTEHLLNKIDLLSQKGIVPVIKLSAKGFPEMESFETVQEVVDHLYLASQRNKLNLKWLYPARQFISPLDARFYLDPPETARLAQRPIYKSTLGKTASEGFAALRRMLRVKNISDSYESAGL